MKDMLARAKIVIDRATAGLLDSGSPAHTLIGDIEVLDRLEVCDLDVLGVWPGARVLDVGCQVGRLMLRLQQRGCAVFR